MPKRLELLTELVPQARVIALLVNPNDPRAEGLIRDVQEAARTKGVQLPILKASTEGEIDAAFTTLVQLPAGALVVSADPLFSSRREQLVALASRHAVPAISPWRELAAAGGLISYGASITGLVRQAGHLCRKNPQRRDARRSACPAADDIRVGHQSPDRQGARPHCAAIDPRPRRRGRRMSNCLLREAGVPMLDGVAGRGFAVRLDCKPNDNFHQRLGRYFQPRFGTVMNKNG